MEVEEVTAQVVPEELVVVEQEMLVQLLRQILLVKLTPEAGAVAVEPFLIRWLTTAKTVAAAS